MINLQKFLKNSKSIIIFTIFLFAFFVFPHLSLMATTPQGGLDETAGVIKNYPYTAQNNADYIPSKIGQIVGAVLAFVGIIFFVLIIYGGFMWMTAGGDEQKVTKAKDLITQAVIGLIIVLAAYAITAFIGTELTE